MVKESKQGQEHVPMMLKTLASHSASKEAASSLQLIGNRGPIALKHAVMASKQEQEHVLIMKKAPPMSQKLRKQVALWKNAVMTLGHHGVRLTVAPIMVKALSKRKNLDRDTLRLRVQTLLKPKLD